MSTVSHPSPMGLFRNRFVQAILLSGLLLQIGIWVRNYAILLFVMEMTNEDPFAISMIYVAEFVPIFVFSFIGGTFADRWRPKRTMIWCDLLSAVSVFVVLLTLMFATWHAVFFATLISAILSQFSQPSGMKLFKLHVPEELMQMGMSLYQTMFALFMILGPVLGTFVYQSYGINVAILIMGVAFLLSAAALTLLPADRQEEKKEISTTVREEMAQGFRYVLQSRSLTLLGGCFMLAGLAIGLIQPLAVFLVTERLGLDKENLQWLMMANGIGMIVGGGLAMVFARKIAPQRLLAFGMVVSAVGMLIVGFSTNLWLTLGGQLLSGLVMPAIQIGISTLILQSTESSFVDRVNGILNPLFMGSMVVTMMVSGVLKPLVTLVGMFTVAAVLFVIGVIVISPLLGSSYKPGTAGNGSDSEASAVKPMGEMMEP